MPGSASLLVRVRCDDLVEALLEPACRNGVRRVVFVVYGDDIALARRCGRALEQAFARERIEVLEMLRADGGRWFPLLGRRPGVPEWGVPYDVSAHPFVAEAVVDGKVTHASREALAASLDREPGDVDTTAGLVAELTPWSQKALPTTGEILVEGTWVRELVARHAAAGSLPTDGDVARLLRSIQVKRIRDAAWALLDREAAPAHAAFWTAIVRRTPDRLLAPAATLLGWAAWQSGHGALAWCAVDLCAGVDADYTLMIYLADLLEHAVPPMEWMSDFDWSVGLGPAG